MYLLERRRAGFAVDGGPYIMTSYETVFELYSGLENARHFSYLCCGSRCSLENVSDSKIVRLVTLGL
jgi:hypothetical protein